MDPIVSTPTAASAANPPANPAITTPPAEATPVMASGGEVEPKPGPEHYVALGVIILGISFAVYGLIQRRTQIKLMAKREDEIASKLNATMKVAKEVKMNLTGAMGNKYVRI